MPKSTTERAPARKQLQAQLDDALRAALQARSTVDDGVAPIPAVHAIETAAGNRKITLRRALDVILEDIVKLEPKKARDGGTIDDLLTGIDATTEVLATFSKIVEAIAVTGDSEAATDICRWFGNLFDRYDLPEGFSGRFNRADHDFFKFLGHEMFVTVVAFLIREQQWDVLKEILAEPISTRTHNRGPRVVNWEYASKHLVYLADESPRRQRISLHADLLNMRHGEGGALAILMPMRDLMDADFFLFLFSQTLETDEEYSIRVWRAWSCLYLKFSPIFVQRSEYKRIAEQISNVLGLNDTEQYKTLLKTKGRALEKLFNDRWWNCRIDDDLIERIATR